MSFFGGILSVKPFCELRKCICILIQGQILFIALSYNKFCRPGEYDIDVMSYFFDETNNTFSPENEIECLLLCISILIQGHILFIALSYNKFCRSGEYDIDIDVMSYFFDEKNNTFSPESEIEYLLLYTKKYVHLKRRQRSIFQTQF